MFPDIGMSSSGLNT